MLLTEECLRLAKVVKPTYRLHIGARVNAALLTFKLPTYLLTYLQMKCGGKCQFRPVVPTRGPRAKSGPPSLKMWPAALDKLNK